MASTTEAANAIFTSHIQSEYLQGLSVLDVLWVHTGGHLGKGGGYTLQGEIAYGAGTDWFGGGINRGKWVRFTGQWSQGCIMQLDDPSSDLVIKVGYVKLMIYIAGRKVWKTSIRLEYFTH